MKKIFITGNLTSDPATSTTPSGAAVCNFSVAVNETVKGNKETTFFRVGAWGKTGEACQTYLKKGNKVMVCGNLQTPRPYTNKQGQVSVNLEIMADNVEFLSAPAQSGPAPAAPAGFTAVENDEIPF